MFRHARNMALIAVPLFLFQSCNRSDMRIRATRGAHEITMSSPEAALGSLIWALRNDRRDDLNRLCTERGRRALDVEAYFASGQTAPPQSNREHQTDYRGLGRRLGGIAVWRWERRAKGVCMVQCGENPFGPERLFMKKTDEGWKLDDWFPPH